ncbi:secreted regulator of the activity of phosphatase [Bacillus velezensis M27]|uniref:Phosphatase n=1 Tax=Bacillus velezensis TaxID=492670 RepID=A0A6A8LAD7_BACVE|nr:MULTISPECIES: PhrC/PhrF family phosphatase-inhibitory pheromone [Bacillus]AIU75414.1 phosphatase [Bacillus subtilis]MBT2713540.1 PhrC/PhrF family phosphatase-inhibitory pheromone [Pseudomonas sp. ISL-88]UXZ17672.1 PhrC/PhrF family phosphatase-inhibitory pheromone [Bacillus siamensis]COC93380.1 Rap-phr extracellular signalling [Streptococcus pneumoniae]ASF56837.1 phosphatase [Bacillus velezensis]
MKLKYKVLLTCLAVTSVFITADMTNTPSHQFEVAQRAMI